ncbi:MAG: amino acid deaminase [Kiritimatiellae bacterium]|nr:amino acid deaminase [Kiritimatiellia bacterium]
MDLREIHDLRIDDRYKGIPGGIAPFPLGAIGGKGWNVLREDLSLPLLVLRQSALDHNSRWMQRFIEKTGVRICPHAKTHMAPQLFKTQLENEAWGLCAATVDHLQIYRRFGVSRVLFANQLVGKQAVRYVLDELERDPAFDFYCLVDSVEGVRSLASAAEKRGAGRPIQVLIEVGVAGERAGCRTLAAALATGRAVKAAAPHLVLRGVEGYEGVFVSRGEASDCEKVDTFLDFLAETAVSCEAEDLFAEGEILLSAGCTSFFDLSCDRLARVGLKRGYAIVIRSGCYLTHDSGAYTERFNAVLARSPELKALGPGLEPSLELWGYVQSVPEPTTAILTFGRRDCPFDKGPPIPGKWLRPGGGGLPSALGASHRIRALNDQHAMMTIPEDSPLHVGDMVGAGISHPCGAFERWPLVPVIDEAYNVVSAVRTFF